MEAPVNYKVLVDGKSCHGGELTWSLPQRKTDGSWTPGDWHSVDGDLCKCEHGLHVTTDPVRWYAVGSQVYSCEIEGAVGEPDADAKLVCRRARLLHQLTDEELAEIRWYRYGAHEIHDGHCLVEGSATVRASGSATVEAWGSATVEAWGSATVRAHKTVTVIAHWGSATVQLYDRAVLVDQRGKMPVATIATEASEEEK
jgi:hypothetical protein